LEIGKKIKINAAIALAEGKSLVPTEPYVAPTTKSNRALEIES